MKLVNVLALPLLLICLVNISYGQDIETITYPSGNVYVGEFRDNERTATKPITPQKPLSNQQTSQ